jgi:Tfp pilus assembly protein PilF
MTLAKDRGAGEAAVLIEQADRSFRAALQLPGGNTPQNLGNYAVFLAHVRCSHAEAGSYFDQAIEADPSRAETLVNYAHFLEMCEQDDDRAQLAFDKALEVCGDTNAGLLGSYALFRCRTHEDDVDDNDALFKRTIAADPANGPNLAAYASFLSSVLGQNDQADILFRRAIEHCSHDATIIGAYASFVAEVLHDNDSAEVYFRRALEAEPDNTTNLGRYAYFLHAVRGDHHAADLHYQRAVRCGNDADILGNYATFLETEKDDYDAAEIYYKQAVAADPNHSYNLASYARFLAYTQNDNAAGFDFFSRAVASDLNDVAVLNFFIDFLQNIVESDANAPTYYRDAVTDFPQCSPLLQVTRIELNLLLGGPAPGFVWPLAMKFCCGAILSRETLQSIPRAN